MDDLDEHLIERLRLNARAPVAELARGLGLSRTTIQSRLIRLERSGVIAGYAVRLSAAREGAAIKAVVQLSVDPKNAAGVAASLERISGVRRLQSTSGAFGMAADIEAAGMGDLDALIEEIGAVKGVERTSVSVILATKFER